MQAAFPERTDVQNSPRVSRLHGLDALRGVAAVLVVLLHAGIPYMSNPFPHLVWPARDAQPCDYVDALTWCSEGFLMPLFFVLAGFFAQMQLCARGERCFLAARTRRLLYTQFTAGLAILPICLWIWVLGWMAEGRFIPKDILLNDIPTELNDDLWGTAHIWFLQNLYIYSLLLCGIHCWARRLHPRHSERVSRLMRVIDGTSMSALKPLLPVIPGALILYHDPRIVLGFYQSFFPIISKLAYYAIYFFLGATLNRNGEALARLAQYGKTYLLVAGVLFAAALPRICEHVASPLSGVPLASLAGLLALFASFATFGLIAMFVRLVPSGNAVTRYLADASFWVYLIHLPMVVLIQIDMVKLPVPTFVKFLLTGFGALSLALVTYHMFVRTTWLGEFLNGQRVPRLALPVPALPVPTLPVPALAVPGLPAAVLPVPVLTGVGLPSMGTAAEVPAPWLAVIPRDHRTSSRAKPHGTHSLGGTT